MASSRLTVDGLTAFRRMSRCAATLATVRALNGTRAIECFFELGLSIPEVALISGHRDTRMLMRYTHLRPEAVAAKLAGLLDTPELMPE